MTAEIIPMSRTERRERKEWKGREGKARQGKEWGSKRNWLQEHETRRQNVSKRNDLLLTDNYLVNREN